MNTPEEVSEAVAKALWSALPDEYTEWEDLPEDLLTARNLRRQSRIALEAAAPFIAAQAWDEGYCAGWLDNENKRNTRNPHRKDAP